MIPRYNHGKIIENSDNDVEKSVPFIFTVERSEQGCQRQMSGTRAKSVIWMEKLIYWHIAIKITLGEAVVRGDLSTPKYVTDVYLYQETVEMENDSAAKVG